MERADWLKKIRAHTETLYDHLAPAYWETYGLYDNTTHCQFIEKFLGHLSPMSTILDAACGAGRYDGMLLEAGHAVLGIDQSGSMLRRAREHFPPERFPGLRYEKIGLQEMDFKAEFDGVVCIDAMEHIFPEDWPGILGRFSKALKPDGMLYMTVEVAESCDVSEAYERARQIGLPVVYGEIADKVDATYEHIISMDWQAITGEQADTATYHFYPPLQRVRGWLNRAGLTVEEEGSGNWYKHFLVRKI